MKFTSTGDPQKGGGMTSLYLDPLLSALSAMEDIQNTCLGGYPVGVEHQIYSKWSSLPLVTMGEITSQSCTWTPCCQCYVLLRTLKTHDWVGMQWPTRHNTRRTCGFLFKAREDLAEFCTWTPCCQFYLRWKTLGTHGWVGIQWKLSSSHIFLSLLLLHSRLYFFHGSHLVGCLCIQWSFKIAYYCYIFAHYHPTIIIWNVAKNSGLRYMFTFRKWPLLSHSSFELT